MTDSIDVLKYIKSQLPSVTKTKALKLLYYAQAWSLVWDGRRLFPEDVRAWQYGPVEPNAFVHFDGTSANADAVPKRTKEVTDAVLQYYGSRSAKELTAMTHSERPWSDAYEGPDGGHAKGNLISESAMTREYTEQSLRGGGPRKPGACAVDARAADVDRLLNRARANWRETLDILANR